LCQPPKRETQKSGLHPLTAIASCTQYEKPICKQKAKANIFQLFLKGIPGRVRIKEQNEKMYKQKPLAQWNSEMAQKQTRQWIRMPLCVGELGETKGSRSPQKLSLDNRIHSMWNYLANFCAMGNRYALFASFFFAIIKLDYSSPNSIVIT
jgi:hypothetical protein